MFIDEKYFKTYIPFPGDSIVKENIEFSAGKHKLTAYEFYAGADSIQCSIEFFVKDYVINELLSPISGETIMTKPKFLWARIEDYEKYWIEVDTSLNFENPIISDSNINKTEYEPKISLETNRYFWRVRVRSYFYPYNSWGKWSYTDSFYLKRWEYICEAGWSKRMGGACLIFDGRLFLLGGKSYNSYNNDVWYSYNGINWIKSGDAQWSVRSLFSSVIFNDKLWVIGGKYLS